jgi:uncharacterized protein YneF (UPF0154 family)
MVPAVVLIVLSFYCGIRLGVKLDRYMLKEMKKRPTIKGIPRKWC